MKLQITILLITCSWIFAQEELTPSIAHREEFGVTTPQDGPNWNKAWTTGNGAYSSKSIGEYSTMLRKTTSDDVQESTPEVPFTTAREGITTDDNRESTVIHPRNHGCKNLYVKPQKQSQLVGEMATYLCVCELPTGSISVNNCPEWRDIDDVLHTHSRSIVDNTCIVTLKLGDIRLGTQKHLICADTDSHARAYASLEVIQRSYDEHCRLQEDCSSPYQCKESKCSCSDKKPILVKDSTEKCYPVRKLRSPCLYTVQCQGNDRNSYCQSNPENSTEEGICLCGDGYDIQNNNCVSSDSVFNTAYRYSKKYQAVFFGFICLGIIFILLGLLRICMVRKRDMARKTGRSLSTTPLDEHELTTAIQKRKF